MHFMLFVGFLKLLVGQAIRSNIGKKKQLAEQ